MLSERALDRVGFHHFLPNRDILLIVQVEQQDEINLTSYIFRILAISDMGRQILSSDRVTDLSLLSEALPLHREVALHKALTQCLQHRKPLSYALPCFFDAVETSIPVSLWPIYSLEKEPLQVIAFWEGVDAEKQDLLTEPTKNWNHLINALPGIVFRTANDSHWSMTYLSEGCRELTGYHSAEIIGSQRITTYDDITHPEDRVRVWDTISHAIAQKRFYDVEYRLITRTGEERWVWEKGSGVYNVHGELTGLEGFITDITTLKTNEAELQQKTLELQSIFQALPDIYFRLDAEGRILDCHTGQPEDLGLYPLDFMGKLMPDIFPAPVGQRFQRAIAQVLHTHQMVDLEYELSPKLGERQIFEARLLPLNISNLPVQSLTQIMVIVRNISERKRAEEEIRLLQTLVQGISEAADFHSALQVALEKVCTVAGWDYGEVWIPTADQIRLKHSLAAHGNTPALQRFHQQSCQLTFAPGAGLPGRVWQTREPEWMQDIDHQPNGSFIRTELAISAGFRSGLAVPILSRERDTEGQESAVIAVLVFFTYASRPENLRLVQLITSIATQIGSLMLRKQAEESLRQTNLLLKTQQVALQQTEKKYRSIFENSLHGIFQTTPQGQYLSANPALARIYGYDSVSELITSLGDIAHQLYVVPERRAEFIRLIQDQNTVVDFESQIYRKDGCIIWILEQARIVRDDNGEVLYYEGTVEDITERKCAELELLRRDTLLIGVAQAMNVLLIHADFSTAISKALSILGEAAEVDRVYIYENHPHSITGEPAMSMRFEWTRASIEPSIHSPHWQDQSYGEFGLIRWYENLSNGKSVKEITQKLPIDWQEILKRDQILSILLVPIVIDDYFWGYIGFDDCKTERFWLDSEESILKALAGSIGGALKRQKAEATIRHHAFYDQLTNLPNRIAFNESLTVCLGKSDPTHHNIGVLFLDLDRFKTINDTLGHAMGDQLLQQVGDRLARCLRQEDCVARWGGDEFTVLLSQIHSATEVTQVAQRLLDVFKTPFKLGFNELYVSASIGIALYPQDGKDLETLLRNADVALYQAKERRNSFQLYLPSMNSAASELLLLENDLHHALEYHELLLYYQPRVNIQTGRVVGMEALLRWKHSQRGLISPSTFIPLAEETGLIEPIGEWVLRTACAQNKAWQDAGFPPIQISVNLSACQFQNPHLVEMISQILTETDLAPEFLELEITETTVIQDVEFTRQMMQVLSQMGVRLAIDDFGTGYSSLGYLKTFQLHTLKIDRVFVRDLRANSPDAAIVSAVLALGEGLNLSVVAEGVENLDQLELLQASGCQEIQGYIFSPPLPVQDATYFLNPVHSVIAGKRFETVNRTPSQL